MWEKIDLKDYLLGQGKFNQKKKKVWRMAVGGESAEKKKETHHIGEIKRPYRWDSACLSTKSVAVLMPPRCLKHPL